ncbi:MAG: hypothetical protein WBY53_13660 [Acidobacteriaceae bacterium]
MTFREFKSSRSLLRERRALSYCCFATLTLFLPAIFALQAHAQGGPPYRTDDPETPGNKHWEINFGFIGDRNPEAGAYQVPDFDINYGLGDRLQLKYEIPIAIEETRPQPATQDSPALPGQVIVGLGESLLGIKWRFYEHHPRDPLFHDRFGTGLLSVFGHPDQPTEPHPISPDAETAPETNFSISTYPQLYLNNPTSAIRRGLVAPGPNFFLPVEVNGRLGPLRLDGEVGYNFGNHALPQSWSRGLLIGHEFSPNTEINIELNDQQDASRIHTVQGVGQFATGIPKQRQTTLGMGLVQTLNKSLNLLLMGGRSFQTISADNSQPSWIAYVGLQLELSPKDHTTP